MNESVVVYLFLTVRVLLVGGVFLFLPRVTRKGLLFGSYVGEALTNRDEVRRLLRGWSIGCVILMTLSLLVGLGITLAGRPVAGNLTGTAVLLLGGCGLYLRFHFKVRELVPPDAARQAAQATAPLTSGVAKGAGFAKIVFGTCLLMSLATFTYAVIASSDHWLDKSFVAHTLIPGMNLVLSPFLALIAILTAGAKRSIRGGFGGRSAEAQDAFRNTMVITCSRTALLICVFLTLLSVEIIRVDISGIQSSGIWILVGGGIMISFLIGNLIWILRRYGQGGALMETGTAETPLSGGLADNVHWVWGLFYVDKNDPSTMVESRFGLGYDFNYGNRTAILILTIFLVMCLSLASVCLIGVQRSFTAESASLPNTAAGQCAAAYFDAFNSGSAELMQAFQDQYRARAYLETRSLEKRMAHYERFRDLFGQLTPLRITFDLELQLTLLSRGTKTKDVLVLRFHLEDEPPHRLAYLTFSGIDHSRVHDGYVDYVATRAAPIDSALRASTIQSVARVLRDQYVYPELGGKMADALLRQQAEGRYNDVRKVGKLADMLTEDALVVSHDKHIWVEAQNPRDPESSDPANRPVEELRRENFHFRKVEVLQGNIGYIKFDMIHDDKEALEIAAAALDSLAQCDALIFDIRDNIGGEWGTADLILGYLFPGGTVFGYMYDRGGHIVEERATPDSVPGQPFDIELPVYVLTSNRTGSAAEGFAYTLKSLSRATIVGEVTAGGGHPSKEVVINDYFRMSVPFLRPENAVTGTSFEGKGVVPQIKVAADKALKAAIKDALRRIGNHR